MGMNNSTLSPIAIFGYDRPIHLQNLLSSLMENDESRDSDVYFFIDGIKNETNLANHQSVVEIINKNWGFKNKNIIIREDNFGCRRNIIEGVNQVLKLHKRIIVLEDDLTVGKYFLDYMNKSLKKYELREDIWHINSWSHPKSYSPATRTALSRYISPWGWGTWENRWDKFMRSEFIDNNIISTMDKATIKKFNVSNLYDWENILIKHEQNQGSIWDAYWYQAMFLNHGYSIFPTTSHTQNSGFDGTGLHCGENNEFDTTINIRKTTRYTNQTSESKIYLLSFKLFYFRNKMNDYISFHKDKFSSVASFVRFLKKKILS